MIITAGERGLNEIIGTDLYSWQRAKDGITLASDRVSLWEDLSGNDRNFEQINETVTIGGTVYQARPTREIVAGKLGLRFSCWTTSGNINSYMDMVNVITLAPPFSIAIVWYSAIAITSQQNTFYSNIGTAKNRMIAGTSSSNMFIDNLTARSLQSTLLGSSPKDNTVKWRYSINVHNKNSSKIYTDGVLDASGGINELHDLTSFRVGGAQAASTAFQSRDLYVADISIIQGDISADSSKMTAINNYMKIVHKLSV